jgi:hypothetical protein
MRNWRDIPRETNLERDVLVAKSDLKLLSAVLVLLWPLCVVFPVAVVNIGAGEVMSTERHTS